MTEAMPYVWFELALGQDLSSVGEPMPRLRVSYLASRVLERRSCEASFLVVDQPTATY